MTAVLEFLVEDDRVRYRGVTTDLRGRPAVAFSGPHRSGGGAEATVLYSTDTGQAIGWEYGTADGSWRLELEEYSLSE